MFLYANLDVSIVLVPTLKSLWDFFGDFGGKQKFMIHTHK